MSTHLPVVSNNESPNLCTPCGGRCCKTAPGECHPSDFGAPNETEMRKRLYERLSSGLWTIDWAMDLEEENDWESEPDGIKEFVSGHFVRPAVVGRKGRVFDSSWKGGCCILLTEKGCPLSWEDRPHGCKALVPGMPIGPGCKSTYGYSYKQQASIDWIPYQELLLEVARLVESER